jgi:preprotein translocase subunit YajC
MKNWPIISFFLKLYEDQKRKKRFKKKLEELKKRDPFIYKH